MVTDTHCHLNDDKFKEDYLDIIKSMQSDNLSNLIIASYDYKSMTKAMQQANENKNVYALLGMHPHDSRLYDEKFEKFLFENATNEKVVGIGEIGLDYYYNLSTPETQKKVFIRQLEIANQLNLPISIHTRDAWQDLLEILKANKNLLNNSGVIHCFSGSQEIANELLKLGFYLGFGGVVTFKNANKILECIKNISLNRILVETDCPYLTPEPFRGRRNEPKFVNYVVNKIAEIKGMHVAELEQILEANTKQLFKKMV